MLAAETTVTTVLVVLALIGWAYIGARKIIWRQRRQRHLASVEEWKLLSLGWLWDQQGESLAGVRRSTETLAEASEAMAELTLDRTVLDRSFDRVA